MNINILELITKKIDSGDYIATIIITMIAIAFSAKSIYEFLLRISRQKEQYLLENLKNIKSLTIDNRILIKQHLNNMVSSRIFGVQTDSYMLKEIMAFYEKNPKIDFFDIITAREYFEFKDREKLEFRYGVLDSIMLFGWWLLFAVYVLFSVVYIYKSFNLFMGDHVRFAMQPLLIGVVYTFFAYVSICQIRPKRSAKRIVTILNNTAT